MLCLFWPGTYADTRRAVRPQVLALKDLAASSTDRLPAERLANVLLASQEKYWSSAPHRDPLSTESLLFAIGPEVRCEKRLCL